MSVLLRDVLADDDDDGDAAVPLPNVKGSTLKKVMEFCQRHVQDPMPTITRPITSTDMRVVLQSSPWDAEFVESVADNHETLFDLILAANYLNIPSLLDLTCAKLAAMIKGKTPREIRKLFRISEPTPEEEEQIKRDHAWVFDARPTGADAPSIPSS